MGSLGGIIFNFGTYLYHTVILYDTLQRVTKTSGQSWVPAVLCYTPRKGWGVDIRLLLSSSHPRTGSPAFWSCVLSCTCYVVFAGAGDFRARSHCPRSPQGNRPFFFFPAVLLLGSAKLPDRAGSWAARSLLLGACSTQQMCVGKEENEQ